MPSIPLPWPTTALPGRRPGEGSGDLINAYAAKIGDTVQIRRTPGLTHRLTLPDSTFRAPRGMLPTVAELLHVWDGELRATRPDGTDHVVTGALPGVDRVTMAVNMRQTPTPQVVIVTELDVYIYDTGDGTLNVLPDTLGNLGAGVNSVEYYSGYFVYTKESGVFMASDLQEAEVPDLSFANAQYAADPLYRSKAHGAVLLVMGSRSIEVWVDVGSSPFPFQRQTSLDVGLFGPWAVAGGSNVWASGVLFVANDYTVRHMQALQAPVVSNDDVSHDIYQWRGQTDAITAQVYDFEQQGVFSISSPDWTWEYNVATQAWHRRDSYNQNFWRATNAVMFYGRWIAQDHIIGQLVEIEPGVYDEVGTRMRARVDSAPIKAFPATMRIPSIDIDINTAAGRLQVPSPSETDPCVMVSWSHDGGATWARPLARSLGREGRFSNKVTVNNLGRSTHHGTRLRLELVDPVPLVLTGGVSTRTRPSRPRGVD